MKTNLTSTLLIIFGFVGCAQEAQAVPMNPCRDSKSCLQVLRRDLRNTQPLSGRIYFQFNPNIEFGSGPGYFVERKRNQVHLTLMGPISENLSLRLGSMLSHRFELVNQWFSFPVTDNRAKLVESLAAAKVPLLLEVDAHTFEAIIGGVQDHKITDCIRGLQYEYEYFLDGKSLSEDQPSSTRLDLDIYIQSGLSAGQCVPKSE